MKASRELLETELGEYEAAVRGLKSFIKELKVKTAEHGTDRELFEADLIEAEHNIKYYEDTMAHLTDELGKPGKPERSQTGADTILPRTTKQCLGSLIFSSVSFVAGLILGSRLKSLCGTQASQEKKASVGDEQAAGWKVS